MQGQILGSKGKTKRAEKTRRRVLLPVPYFSARHFPRPFKLSLALGLFTGSHEDVCQWTVVFILSVLNWGYIISGQSVLNGPYKFVRVWRYYMHDWVDLLLDFFCPKHGEGFKPSRSPGHPKGSPVPKYWSNNSLRGSVMPRIRKVVEARLYHFSKGNNTKALAIVIFVVGQRGYFRKLYLVSSLEIVLFPIVFLPLFPLSSRRKRSFIDASRENGNERL